MITFIFINGQLITKIIFNKHIIQFVCNYFLWIFSVKNNLSEKYIFCQSTRRNRRKSNGMTGVKKTVLYDISTKNDVVVSSKTISYKPYARQWSPNRGINLVTANIAILKHNNIYKHFTVCIIQFEIHICIKNYYYTLIIYIKFINNL